MRKSGNGPPDGKQSASLRTIRPDTLTEAGSPIGHHRRPVSTPRTLIVRRLISLGSPEEARGGRRSGPRVENQRATVLPVRARRRVEVGGGHANGPSANALGPP